MIPHLERSFVLEVDFGTEGYRGVLLQPDEAGWLWPVGCSKLKGDEYHWTTLEGVLYTIHSIVYTSLQTCYGSVWGLKLGLLFQE